MQTVGIALIARNAEATIKGCIKSGVNMKNRDKLWLAAAIDFESSLSLLKQQMKTKRGFCWRPVLHMANTNILLINELRRICGGNGFVGISAREHSKGTNRKLTYQIDVSAPILRKILPQVVPFLIAKKRQGKLIVEAMGLCRKGHKGKNDKRLEEIYNDMKRLNQRGC